MVKIIGWILLFLWFVVTFYLIAPSAEQLTKMVQMVSAMKAGVGFTSSATVETPGATARSTATAIPSKPSADQTDAAPTSRK